MNMYWKTLGLNNFPNGQKPEKEDTALFFYIFSEVMVKVGLRSLFKVKALELFGGYLPYCNKNFGVLFIVSD